MTGINAAGASAGGPVGWPGLRECLGFAGESYLLLGRRFGAFLLLSLPWVILDVLAQLLPPVPAKTVVLLVITFAGGSAVAVGTHRILLLGETAIAAMRPRAAVLQFFFLSAFAFVIALAVLFVVMPLLASLTAQDEDVLVPLGAILESLIFLGLISLRLLAFPALAVGEPGMRFWGAFARPGIPARGQWAILAGTLVAGFPVLAVDFALQVAAPGMGIVLAILYPLLVLAMAALVAGYSSALYRRVGRGSRAVSAVGAGSAASAPHP